jgi:hypothetical protein
MVWILTQIFLTENWKTDEHFLLSIQKDFPKFHQSIFFPFLRPIRPYYRTVYPRRILNSGPNLMQQREKRQRESTLRVFITVGLDCLNPDKECESCKKHFKINSHESKMFLSYNFTKVTEGPVITSERY